MPEFELIVMALKGAVSDLTPEKQALYQKYREQAISMIEETPDGEALIALVVASFEKMNKKREAA